MRIQVAPLAGYFFGTCPLAFHTGMSTGCIRVFAPTLFEYLVTRTHIAHVEWAGMSLSRRAPGDGPVILAGLAGSLDLEVAPGTVVIPRRVGGPNGQMRECDPILRLALATAASDRGYRLVDGDLLTADHLILGEERATCAQRGFVAADMETGLLPYGIRFATVRVVVDSPDEELPTTWGSLTTSIPNPALVRQAARIARDAPRFARRAAGIVRDALEQLEGA